jgi:hypothetical protein
VAGLPVVHPARQLLRKVMRFRFVVETSSRAFPKTTGHVIILTQSKTEVISVDPATRLPLYHGIYLVGDLRIYL